MKIITVKKKPLIPGPDYALSVAFHSHSYCIIIVRHPGMSNECNKTHTVKDIQYIQKHTNEYIA